MAVDEGTVTFWIAPIRPDAFTDALPARFPPVTSSGITVRAAKSPDRRLEATISGIHRRHYTLSGPLPRVDKRGLMLTVTWTLERVTLYLSGTEVDHFELTTH